MAFIEASLEELPVSANLGQSCLATKISAPGPGNFGWFRQSTLLLEVKMMNRRLRLLDLLVLASLIMLLVSFACKFFLDHPQNFRVCWRGSRPSPVRG